MLGLYGHLWKLVFHISSGMGTGSGAKPTEEKVKPSIHSWLDFCDSKLVLLLSRLSFPMYIILFSSSRGLCSSRFLARKERKKKEEKKGRRKGQEKVGGRQEGNVSLFHVTCHYSLRNGNLTKCVKYKYCWSKYLQPITNLCHSNTFSSSVWALSL